MMVFAGPKVRSLAAGNRRQLDVSTSCWRPGSCLHELQKQRFVHLFIYISSKKQQYIDNTSKKHVHDNKANNTSTNSCYCYLIVI